MTKSRFQGSNGGTQTFIYAVHYNIILPQCQVLNEAYAHFMTLILNVECS